MGLLANAILASEALLAYLTFALRLVEIYVPFVDKTEAGNAQAQESGISPPIPCSYNQTYVLR